MKTNKRVGIWMDHSAAILMELANDTIVKSNIESEYTNQEKEFTFTKNENVLHNKEQQLRLNYYKKLSDAIRNFQEVLLFGPTDAKKELLNMLKADHLFAEIKIELKQADKMTENQMNAFVKEHFGVK